MYTVEEDTVCINWSGNAEECLSSLCMRRRAFFIIEEIMVFNFLTMGSAREISLAGSAGRPGVLVSSAEGEVVPPSEEQSVIAFCSWC